MRPFEARIRFGALVNLSVVVAAAAGCLVLGARAVSRREA